MDIWGNIETWVIKTSIKAAIAQDNPVALAAVVGKSALQIAKNDGSLDPANRSKIQPVAEVQTLAEGVEDAMDPYLHVDRNVIISALPGGPVGFKVASFVFRHAPIPAAVRSTAREVVDTVIEKIEGPAGPSGGNEGLAA